MTKEYLGDSVYVDFDGYGLTLTTENGLGPMVNAIPELDASKIIDDAEELALYRSQISKVRAQLSRALIPLIFEHDGKVSLLQSAVTIAVQGDIHPDRPEVSVAGESGDYRVKCVLRDCSGGPGTWGEGVVRKARYAVELKEAQ